MKISGPGSIKFTTGARKSSAAGPVGDFAGLLAASGSEAAAPAASAGDVAAAALSNLLALQEISESDIQRRRLVQQGDHLLDVLEQLRRRLLLGTLPPRLLQDLSRAI